MVETRHAATRETINPSETAAVTQSFDASSFSFAFGGKTLSVRTNDPWAIRVLEHAYLPLRAVCTQANHSAVIKTDGLHLVLEYGSRTLTFGRDTLGEFGAAFYALRELFARFAASNKSSTAFYGASVAFGGDSAVLLGPPTVGKTVLSLHLANAGARFLGDETFVLDPRTAEVSALPRLPALREPALSMLPNGSMVAAVRSSPSVVSLPGGRLWYALAPNHLCGIAPDPSPRRLSSVIIVRGRRERSSLTAITKGELLHCLLARAYFKPSCLSELAEIRRALHDVRGFNLWLGDPQATAALLRETLRCT